MLQFYAVAELIAFAYNAEFPPCQRFYSVDSEKDELPDITANNAKSQPLHGGKSAQNVVVHSKELPAASPSSPEFLHCKSSFPWGTSRGLGETQAPMVSQVRCPHVGLLQEPGVSRR